MLLAYDGQYDACTQPAFPNQTDMHLLNGKTIMNRKKKLNDAFNKKLKKLNSKLRVSNKPKYISKAERETSSSQEAASIITSGTDSGVKAESQ
jgi:hypothetical protein